MLDHSGCKVFYGAFHLLVLQSTKHPVQSYLHNLQSPMKKMKCMASRWNGSIRSFLFLLWSQSIMRYLQGNGRSSQMPNAFSHPWQEEHVSLGGLILLGPEPRLHWGPRESEEAREGAAQKPSTQVGWGCTVADRTKSASQGSKTPVYASLSHLTSLQNRNSKEMWVKNVKMVTAEHETQCTGW